MGWDDPVNVRPLSRGNSYSAWKGFSVYSPLLPWIMSTAVLCKRSLSWTPGSGLWVAPCIIPSVYYLSSGAILPLFHPRDASRWACFPKPWKCFAKTCEWVWEPRLEGRMFPMPLSPILRVSPGNTAPRAICPPNFGKCFCSPRYATKVPLRYRPESAKAFRNEINPRNYTFRSREFEQMELEFFIKPGTDPTPRYIG